MDIVVRVENLTAGCVTDEKRPRFSFSIESDKQGAELAEATIRVGDWAYKTHSQILIPYGGKPLKPFTEYTVSVEAKLKDGETGRAPWNLSARTNGGRLVHLMGDPALVGRFIDADISGGNTWALYGSPAAGEGGGHGSEEE